jgi:hypothetical protein
MIFVYLLLAYFAVRTLKRVTRPTPAAPRLVPRPAYVVYNPVDHALTREMVRASQEARWEAEDTACRRDLEKRRRLERINHPEIWS